MNPKKGNRAFLVVLILWALPAIAEVYKIVDPVTGKVTFTDNPPPNRPSNTVDVPAVNTQQATVPEAKAPALPSQPAEIEYEDVRILQPLNDTTVPPGQLDVVIQVETLPALGKNHLLRILFNGKEVAKPASTTSVIVDQIVRGSHQIKAEIIDSEGNVLKESKITTIHVKRASVKFNPG